jgi:hypothetical protein
MTQKKKKQRKKGNKKSRKKISKKERKKKRKKINVFSPRNLYSSNRVHVNKVTNYDEA